MKQWTRELAWRMIELDNEIRAAAARWDWDECMKLDDERWEVQHLRSQMMRAEQAAKYPLIEFLLKREAKRRRDDLTA